MLENHLAFSFEDTIRREWVVLDIKTTLYTKRGRKKFFNFGFTRKGFCLLSNVLFSGFLVLHFREAIGEHKIVKQLWIWRESPEKYFSAYDFEGSELLENVFQLWFFLFQNHLSDGFSWDVYLGYKINLCLNRWGNVITFE
jgi:hypothetical protein